MKSKVVRWKHGNHRQGLCVGYVESKREGSKWYLIQGKKENDPYLTSYYENMEMWLDDLREDYNLYLNLEDIDPYSNFSWAEFHEVEFNGVRLMETE